MHQKVNVLIFLIYAQKGQFRKKLKFDHFLVSSCLHLLFPQEKIIKNCSNNISLTWALVFYYLSTSIASRTAKPVGPCQWIYVGLKRCLSGTSNSMVNMTYFPWCRPKWYRDEFNIQSQTLQDLGITLCSMV